MRVCILTHTIPRYFGDPAAPFMDVLAGALVDYGHRVTVLAPYDTRINLSFKRKYKLVTFKYVFPDTLHLLGYSRTLKGDRSINAISYFLSPFYYLFGFFALLKLIKKERFDIISAHWIIPNGFIAALAGKIAKVPFTVTMPGSDIYLAGRNFLFKWMAGYAVKNSSYVISDSSHYFNQLGLLGFYPLRKQVIRYGVEINKYKSVGKVFSNPTILAVGRMVSKKGYIYLIKSLPEIIGKFPNVRLVMVGEGEQKKELETLVKDLGVDRAVEFVGTVGHDKLAGYYGKANIFIAPSIKDEKGNIDASPVSMMEAMASGLPVVTTRFGGSEELIIDGVTGFLVREKNSGDIAKAVVKFLELGDLSDLKMKVRKIARENFSSSQTARKYTKCFRDSIL